MPTCRFARARESPAGGKLATVFAVLLPMMGALMAVLAVVPMKASANVYYVGGSGPGNFTTIQAAINVAAGNDLVYVYKGTYRENIAVAHGVILWGEDKTSTIVDGGGAGDVFRVTAGGVAINGFTITNSANGAGIRALNVNNIWITNDIIASTFYGVAFTAANPGLNTTSLIDSSIFSMNTYGVHVYNCDNVRIVRSTFRLNNYGVHLRSSENNTIQSNNFVNNTWQGSDNGLMPWNGAYPGGGNYWSDYKGKDAMSGPKQDMPGADLIGDTPYFIRDGMNVDNYPLMYPVNSPGGPRNLAATRGDGQVALTWDAPYDHGNCDITGYMIFRGNSPGNETLFDQTGVVLNYTDRGLSNGQRYHYRVSATNCNGEGPKSNEASATPATLPGQPYLYLQQGDEKITLMWSPPASDGGSPITNYSIYRGNSSGAEAFLVETGAVGTYTDAGLRNGATYYYKIAARNDVGLGPDSNEAFGTPATLPSEPRNLKATPGNHGATLTWSRPDSSGGYIIYGYRIYGGTTSGGETLYSDTGNVTSRFCSGLANGRKYYFQVSAKNPLGEGPRSNEVAVTPGWKPSAPQNLTAVEGNQTITLTWSPPADDGGFAVANYSVYRGTTSGGESLLAQVGNTTTHIDTGLSNGVAHFYTVSARNMIGEGPNSTEVSAIPVSVPGGPVNVSAIGGNGRILLSWSPPVNDGGTQITNYTVYKGSISGGEVFLARIGQLLAFADAGVANGQTRFYRITATNGIGEGPASAEVTATAMTIPDQPIWAGMTAGNGKLTLAWLAPADDGGAAVRNYSAYRGFSPGSATSLVWTGTSLTFTDAGLVNGVRYFYAVSARNIVGEGAKSVEMAAIPFNLPPSCEITSPANDSVLSGTIVILGRASDADGILQSIEVRIDGGDWVVLGGVSPWNYSWDTLAVSDGSYTIYAHAFDGENYSFEASVTVDVLNHPVTTTGGESAFMQTWALPVLLITILSGVAAAVVLLVRKRKRRGGCAQYPPAPDRKEH